MALSEPCAEKDSFVEEIQKTDKTAVNENFLPKADDELSYEQCEALQQGNGFGKTQIQRLHRRFIALGAASLNDKLEREVMEQRLPHALITDPLVQRLLDVLSEGANKEISFSSFIRFMNFFEQRCPDESQLELLLEVYDWDCDGLISSTDLFKTLRLITPDCTEEIIHQLVNSTFQELDLDRDGFLNIGDLKKIGSHHITEVNNHMSKTRRHDYSSVKTTRDRLLSMYSQAIKENPWGGRNVPSPTQIRETSTLIDQLHKSPDKWRDWNSHKAGGVTLSIDEYHHLLKSEQSLKKNQRSQSISTGSAVVDTMVIQGDSQLDPTESFLPPLNTWFSGTTVVDSDALFIYQEENPLRKILFKFSDISFTSLNTEDGFCCLNSRGEAIYIRFSSPDVIQKIEKMLKLKKPTALSTGPSPLTLHREQLREARRERVQDLMESDINIKKQPIYDKHETIRPFNDSIDMYTPPPVAPISQQEYHQTYQGTRFASPTVTESPSAADLRLDQSSTPVPITNTQQPDVGYLNKLKTPDIRSLAHEAHANRQINYSQSGVGQSQGSELDLSGFQRYVPENDYIPDVVKYDKPEVTPNIKLIQAHSRPLNSYPQTTSSHSTSRRKKRRSSRSRPPSDSHGISVKSSGVKSPAVGSLKTSTLSPPRTYSKPKSKKNYEQQPYQPPYVA